MFFKLLLLLSIIYGIHCCVKHDPEPPRCTKETPCAAPLPSPSPPIHGDS